MWANSVWGFLGLAVTFVLAVLGLSEANAWLRPWLFTASAGCGLASVVTLLWPFVVKVNGWRRAATQAISSKEPSFVKENRVLANQNIRDFGEIKRGQVSIDLTFINETDKGFVVRQIFLGEFVKSVVPYDGTMSFHDSCMAASDGAGLLFFDENTPTNYQGEGIFIKRTPKTLALSDITVPSRTFVVAPKQTVTTFVAFEVSVLVAPENIISACLGISYIDPNGKNATVTSLCFCITIMVDENGKFKAEAMNGAPSLISIYPQSDPNAKYDPF